ncbi:hypothetical protein HNP40_001953 [Mycobacteroides chelonae]|nr:hypothetical protein [Mycobacteroides chelonae]
MPVILIVLTLAAIKSALVVASYIEISRMLAYVLCAAT